MNGIRIALQAQCIHAAQIESKSGTIGSNLSTSSFDAYKDLAKEGRKVLSLGRREKIEKWKAKVDMKRESAVME